MGNSVSSSRISTQLHDNTEGKEQGDNNRGSKVAQPGEGAAHSTRGEKGKEIAGAQGDMNTNRNSRSPSRGAGLNMPRLPERRRSTPTSESASPIS